MDKDKKRSWRDFAVLFRFSRKTLKHVLMSLISLILALILLTTMTFSWFSVKTSNLLANNFTLDCGKGLRVNDSGTSQLSFMQIEKNLIPASSVDGRNLFFPTDGTDFSNITQNMTFRSANVGDKNQNYIQIDFSLTAQQNHTALYINTDKTSIKVRNTNPQTEYSTTQAAALRSALWSSTAENGVPNTPIVFNPTSNTVYTTAVADVDRATGSFLAGGPQVAHSFSEYSFGGTPVATLSANVETKFSYIIWLEGTDPKCTDRVIGKDIQIELAFTTSWDKTISIRFEDKTEDPQNSDNKYLIKNLLDNENYSLVLRYFEVDGNGTQSTSYSDFNMYKFEDSADNRIWHCNIPGDMRKNIYFVLIPPTGAQNTTTYTFQFNTAGNPTVDRGSNRYYIADRLFSSSGGNNVPYPRGHWVAVGDSDGAGHDSGGGFEGDDF